jgi:hypothetical protein
MQAEQLACMHACMLLQLLLPLQVLVSSASRSAHFWVSCARSGAAAKDDPGDEFFEFSAEDYARVTAAHARAQRAAEAGLRTGKLREAEDARRAARLGPVPIRVHLPDDSILQVFC